MVCYDGSEMRIQSKQLEVSRIIHGSIFYFFLTGGLGGKISFFFRIFMKEREYLGDIPPILRSMGGKFSTFS